MSGAPARSHAQGDARPAWPGGQERRCAPRAGRRGSRIPRRILQRKGWRPAKDWGLPMSLPVMPPAGNRSSRPRPPPEQDDDDEPKVTTFVFDYPNPIPRPPPPVIEAVDKVNVGASVEADIDAITKKMKDTVASGARSPEKLKKMAKAGPTFRP